MKTDYTYCLNKNTCIHRRGCKRWVGNYTDKEVKELYTLVQFVEEVDETKCIPDYEDVNYKDYFYFLDRFRFNDGSEFK